MNKFDINAPIENQRTRNGRKVLRIFDSQLPTNFPLAVFIEGNQGAVAVTLSGRYYDSGEDHACDLQTITPDLVSYHTFYKGGLGTFITMGDYQSLSEAVRGKGDSCILIMEVTVNPDTLESSCKTVWKKTDN
jgi:hypothetical protein